ncbi:MAG TPA: SDR family NAD(P)-dependent oxidoreductase [Desulfatiglandales bacterium]|nr:SDR family NAD(P)-dependent oxidoreductase [Desulfatiglandales bacterium]
MALNLDAIGKKIGPLTKAYTWKDAVTYALGVGAGFSELQYCYEKDLKVIPSFSIVTIYDFMPMLADVSKVNLAGILHGEQEIIFHHPIPPEGILSTEGAITHYYDRGKEKGAFIVAEFETRHSNGQKLYTSIATVLARFDGGFGGDKRPTEDAPLPERAPDIEVPDTPRDDQPLFFRLSGDVFPLHVDAEFAHMAGFERPIMHGLCTHGFACRAVIKSLFPGEPERMTRFKVRFSKPLYPGVPIKTQIWKAEEGKAFFRTINAQTGDVVIDRGVVEWMGKEQVLQREKRQGIRFDGRVAIVTGAGGGLGRAYALELAKRGAKVGVNDLGGGKDGSGGSQSAADKVVEEIKGMGGEAVASYESVSTAEGGEAIVEAALKAFGRVDIVINNAGILRDRTFAKMDSESWDAVMGVHLKGAYHVTRPAFVKMREQGYGRVVLTSSAAGLYGNFGQTNYSAAKMGLVGLMNTLKLEGEKHDIKVNTVVPIAGTRLTEGVLPPEIFERLKPEFVAPIVLYLSSEQCPVTGGIYNAGMGFFNRAAVVTGPGTVIGDGKEIPTPEEVAAQIARIKSLSGGKEYVNAVAAYGPMLDVVSGKKAEPESEAGGGLTVKKIFERIPEVFRPEKASGLDVVFQFMIGGGGGGTWHVKVKDQKCEVKEGAYDKPTTTIKMGDEDFVKMIQGQLNAMSAYTSGKLKVEGDLLKSQLIEKLFKF